MFVRRFRQLSERGDTIVEVLIAIAVISLVMGGAFVMTNRSLQNSRDAQERVNAVKLVESQIEQIKNLASTSSTTLFGPTVPASFCITSAGAVMDSSNTNCTVGVNGSAAGSVQPAFHITVTRSTNTFTVQDTWTSVRGNTQNKVLMTYRVYQ